MTRRRILVTGGAGFIGSRLVRALALAGADQDVEVVVLDSLHPQVHPRREWPALLPPTVRTVLGDVTDSGGWDALLRDHLPDVVVHLAAETGTGQSLTEASRHGRINVVGTTEMLDAFTRRGHVPDGFVLASSRAVYGEGRWTDAAGAAGYPRPRDAARLAAGLWDPDTGTGEPAQAPLPHRAATTQPRPTNVYAATKLAQEHILDAWAGAHDCGLCVLRLQNVYGPGQSLGNPYTGIVTLFAQLALRGEAADVYEDGQILRDFVYVDDVVAALAAAAGRRAGGRVTVDIGSGAPVTLLDLARRLAVLTGAPRPNVSGRYRAGDVRAAHADLGAAAEILGYSPTVDLETGLLRLLDWISEEPGTLTGLLALDGARRA
ncbi:NAD-dependent epimerase/dehydratase family protein [Pseudonocardia sp.]|uniref:NAD-dependent epimerase/dehydratase family protein n=1 Tax=Pseudonocardia sp. TaxID=60912 RepID=UPI003D0C1574